MGMEGNQYAKKLDTPELRQEAYKQYCDHIAKGYQKKSWYFEHPDITLTWQTMENYLRDDPKEFNSEQKQIAECKSMKHWEAILYASAKGENKDANTASLQMIMRNKFGWDRVDKREDDSTGSAQFNQERLLEQINARQLIEAHLVIQE